MKTLFSTLQLILTLITIAVALIDSLVRIWRDKKQPRSEEEELVLFIDWLPQT